MNKDLPKKIALALSGKSNKNEEGWLLVSVIVMTLMLTAIGLSITALATEQYTHTKREAYVQNAELVAEAGIEQSVSQLNSNNSFTGYATPQTFFNNTTQGKGTFTTTITTNSDGSSKTISSTSDIYNSASATTPFVTRTTRVVVVGTGSTGFSVFSGPGGLILSGTANVANSDVYVGGTISMSGNAKIGTASNPVNVDVANDACPTGSNPGSTYPQVCSGTQPITFGNNNDIYGTVCATGQTNTGSKNNIQGGSGGAGLEAGCTAAVSSPPTYNRAAQISAVTTTSSGSSGPYACGSGSKITWPANLELTGDVSLGGNCKLTIDGNVYISGSLSISGSSQITVASSVGTTRPVILTDGSINVSGSSSMIANSSGTGLEFMSFENATGNPAATPTGTSLYQSQQEQNVNVGGGVNVPGMIFDAYWSEVTLSGSGNVGAAAGQTVNINGSGTVIFGTTLSSGSQTWKITSYQPVY